MLANKSLSDLELRQALSRRAPKDNLARLFDGILVVIERDADVLLQFIRQSFPGYTSHDLQHAMRVLLYCDLLLTRETREQLTSVEVFALITAALFHDAGMSDDESKDRDSVRQTHHIRSAQILKSYFLRNLPFIAENGRLVTCIQFIIESHGLTWDEMVSRKEFERNELIDAQTLRPRTLAILLRIADLLDLDHGRSNPLMYWFLPSFFKEEASRLHNTKHRHVTHLNVSSEEISIEVEAHSKAEHLLWGDWFGYLERDVLSANTYVFEGDLKSFQIPKLNLRITKAAAATYEMWPLRFEIDDEGKIWDVISKSIYTGRFDFVRELIQNAIDAVMLRIYLDTSSDIQGTSPRSWNLSGYVPRVILAYSEQESTLLIAEEGVGMSKDGLSRFLFRVASTGFYESKVQRGFRFPGIAKFGVGFISVLTRSSEIVISTRPISAIGNSVEQGVRVTVRAGSREAYVESERNSPFGTRILIRLRDPMAAREIHNYLKDNWRYPSAGIEFLDIDGMTDTLKQISSFGIAIKAQLRDLRSYLDISKFGVGLLGSIQPLYDEAKLAFSKKHEETKKYLPVFYDQSYTVRSSQIDLRRGKSARVALFNDLLELVSVRKLSRKNSADLAGKGVLWLPVRFDDMESGIEWQSLHGFLFHNYRVSKSLNQVPLPFGTDVDGNSTLFLSDEEWEEGEYIDELEQTVPDLYEQLENLRLKKVGPSSEDSERESEALVGLYLSPEQVLTVPMSSGDTDQTDVFSDTSRIVRETKSLFLLQEDIESLNNSVFQDGVLLPIGAYELVPVGTCRAIVNLTASSRLPLNVSRNAIDENPRVLTGWVNNTGEKILLQVLSRIIAAFESFGIVWEVDNVILGAKDLQSAKSYLADLARSSARKICTQFSDGKGSVSP